MVPPWGDAVGALIDGGVSIAGLTVDVQGLELDIPLKAPSDMSQWRVDLAAWPRRSYPARYPSPAAC